MARIAWGALARLIGRAARDPDDPVPDAELLARFARDRDPAAFELLVWRHGAMVLGVCRRAVRDDHLAEDAFQAAFLVLARKAGSVRGNLAGWLYRVARRSAARARKLPRNVAPLPPDLPARPTPDAAERADLSAAIDAEIARLPERMRAAVLLCYLGGQTTDDAARALGVPRGTVLSRLAAARERLAPRFARRGLALPAAGLVAVAGSSELAAVAPNAARAAVAFAAGGGAAGSISVTLAQGMVTAMNITKTLTAATLVAAVGLATTFGVVAAQGSKIEKAAAPAQPPKPPAAEPPIPPRAPSPTELDEETRRRMRDEQLKRLEQVAEALRQEITQQEQSIRRLAEANTDPGAGRTLARLQREYELDRELAVEDVREATKILREARRQLAGAERTVTGANPTVQGLKANLELAEQNAARARAALKTLDDRHDEQLAVVQEKARRATTAAFDAESLLRQLDPQREMLEKVQTRILQVRLGQDLVPPTAVSPPATLDQLLKEVRELREEVREMRKK